MNQVEIIYRPSNFGLGGAKGPLVGDYRYHKRAGYFADIPPYGINTVPVLKAIVGIP